VGRDEQIARVRACPLINRGAGLLDSQIDPIGVFRIEIQLATSRRRPVSP
jgi:hypothetical protein